MLQFFYIYNYGVKTVSNPPTNARDRSTGRFTNACERSTSKHTIQTCMREIHTWQYKQVHYCYFAHRMILKYCIYTPYFMQQITSPLNECSALRMFALTYKRAQYLHTSHYEWNRRSGMCSRNYVDLNAGPVNYTAQKGEVWFHRLQTTSLFIHCKH